MSTPDPRRTNLRRKLDLVLYDVLAKLDRGRSTDPLQPEIGRSFVHPLNDYFDADVTIRVRIRRRVADLDQPLPSSADQGVLP